VIRIDPGVARTLQEAAASVTVTTADRR